MPRVTVFNQVSLDGFFVDRRGDMSWAHADRSDPEWNAFVERNAEGDATLVFGRVTYEMMAGFWTTPLAAEQMPDITRRMNTSCKIVFSRTLAAAPWSNTRLVSNDPAAELRQLKATAGLDLVVLGSGQIVSQLAAAGLVDEYQIVVVPIILGAGRTLFADVSTNLPLRLIRSRVFQNGHALVCYEPRG